jgi:hypothetical protein
MLRSQGRLRRPVLFSFIFSLASFILGLIVLLSSYVHKLGDGADNDALITVRSNLPGIPTQLIKCHIDTSTLGCYYLETCTKPAFSTVKKRPI